MATSDDDAATQANVTLAATELKDILMDWFEEDEHKEFQVFKTPEKI